MGTLWNPEISIVGIDPTSGVEKFNVLLPRAGLDHNEPDQIAGDP